MERQAHAPVPSGADHILVTRAIGHVAMSRREPRAGFGGVGLRCPADAGEDCFALYLLDARLRPDVLIRDAVRGDEVVALWRRAARDLDLPPVILHGDGETEMLERRLGSLVVGACSVRRRRVRSAPARWRRLRLLTPLRPEARSSGR